MPYLLCSTASEIRPTRFITATLLDTGMSDADAEADGDISIGRDSVWVEKYRPQTLNEVVGHEAIIERIKAYVDDGDLSNLLFAGPAGTGKTTTALAIAREIYGDDWQENFMELNASDQRGIDVVRGRIKDFARSSFGEYDFRIIFLDEADALTDEAQSALRRTMEQFSGQTRFILSCNYSSRIIDPIQSRCAVFRFSPLPDEAIIEQVRRVADAEDLSVTEDGLDAIAYSADGDMRRAINALQAAATIGETIDEDAVYAITSTARPEEVMEMAQHAINGDFLAARSDLESLLIDRGIAGGDIIDQLHRSVWDLDIAEDQAVRLMDRIGETEYRIVEGADERIQLEAMLASLARQ